MANTRLIIKSSLISLFIVGFLLKEIIKLPVIQPAMALIAALVFGIGFIDLKPLNRKMIMLLFICSLLLIWSSNGSFDGASAVTENAGLVTLLLTAPMLGAILRYAPYDAVLLSLANKYIKSSYVFYVMIAAVVTVLCPLMSLAAIPFTHQLSRPIASRYPSSVLQMALGRGFICSLYWAPNLITVAVALKYTDLSWQELAPAGIAFSFIAFVITCIIGRFDILRADVPDQQTEALQQSDNDLVVIDKQGYILLILAIQLICILVSLSLLTRFAGLSIYATMLIVAMVLPILFAAIQGKGAVYRQSVESYFLNTLPNMSNEFMLFISIGFFGYALSHSPVIVFLQSHLSALIGISPSLLVLIIIASIGGLAMTGIHPIITISSVAIVLTKIDTGLTHLQLAISLITGYIMYTLTSPFSTIVMVQSALFGESVYAVGVRLNWRYALVLALVMATAIHIWRYL